MDLLPLDRLGARETSPGVLDLGVFLPWVSAADGNRLWVKVIHERDQFLQDIPPLAFELQHSVDPTYGDYWSVQVDLAQAHVANARSAWGTPGRYVYRYSLMNPNTPGSIDWIIDPFAREFGVGKLSAITVGYQDYTWSEAEAGWRTPRLDDLVVYELMVTEFGSSIEGTIAQLDYLADLGINCIELMPMSNVALDIDWGYLPIGYFGIDERFGKRKDFQLLVEEAHRRNIAVILDAVYGHTGDDFPYWYVYQRLAYHENPVMGPFAKDYFGRSTDFNRKLTQDFFYTVNYFWLDRCHVDGFRYDCVPNYWDGAMGSGYANLVYHTYELVKGQRVSGGHWQRFFDQSGSINLIQCAEQLEAPRDVLWQSYSNCTWQDETLGTANSVASGAWSSITNLGLQFGLLGYPFQVTSGGDTIAKTALQYIEDHDHQRFVCNFGVVEADNPLFRKGTRELWYKVQPYLIGLLTSQGIPLIWQGQELGENYWLPTSGLGRTMMLRPVRWDYFYDGIGQQVLGLVRKLLRLRRHRSEFRRGQHFFYDNYPLYQSRGVLLFSRRDQQAFSLVALNFGDSDRGVPFAFPMGGDYREALYGMDNLQGVVAGAERWLTVPSNFGRIWTLTLDQ